MKKFNNEKYGEKTRLYKETPFYMDFNDKIGRIFKIDMKDIL